MQFLTPFLLLEGLMEFQLLDNSFLKPVLLD